MATTATADPGIDKEYKSSNTGTGAHDGVNGTQRHHNYGGSPLAHATTGESARFPAFGGEFQPGLYRPTTQRKIANPAPLGLCAFALTTFVLGLITVNTRGVTLPNIVVGAAFGYGGLVQLLAGMWEMAVGNTFGATALSSYGGFWIAFAIILTPGGFNIEGAYTAAGVPANDFNYAFGFFLMGWFIFTTILVFCTLRSTVAFFLLFFFLDMAFLLLGISYLHPHDGKPKASVNKAGGYFAIFSAFMAWYNAFAGIADSSNSFFIVPVLHFPWSEKARENRAAKSERATV